MPGGSRRFTIAIPPDVADVIQHFSPDLKRGVRAALRALSVEPHEGAPLVRVRISAIVTSQIAAS